MTGEAIFNHEFQDYTLEPVYKSANGLYQPGPSAEVAARRQNINLFLEGQQSWGKLFISDYQAWAELDWTVPHRTYLAVEKFSSKLGEEASGEAAPAIEKLSPFSLNSLKNEVEVIDELGDVLWCTSALARLVDVDINRALAHYLLDEHGIWHQDTTVRQLDWLMESGWQPRASPLDNPAEYDRFSDVDELEPAQNLFLLYKFLSLDAQKQYNYGEAAMVNRPGDRLYTDLNLGREYAKMLVFLTYWAHRWAKSSLEQVVSQNVIKLTDRVNNNLLDKRNR